VNIFYEHADHLNTPRRITRPSDNAFVWRWDSDPFGTTAPNQNPSGLGTFAYNIRFPGQYYQAETGLNQNWNRDYDPLTGRYIESDPIGLRGGLNTYAYTADSPIMLADPNGEDVTVCFYPGFPGHVGVGVAPNQTVGRYPAQDSIAVPICSTVPGVIKPDDAAHDWGAPRQCLTIRTTPAQDAAVNQFIQAARNVPNQHYNLCNNQCTSFVRSALMQAGIPLPSSANTLGATVPKTFFDALENAYSPARTGSW
jgi:RHS repeat-associated protein